MTPSAPENPINSQAQPTEAGLGGGRYVISGTLGAGSQGETLEAVDKREGRPVAIKRFTIRGAKSWKDVELAEREARVLSSLDHPALPRYIEHFEEAGALYLVMEKIEGETLASRRRRGARFDQAQVLRFLKEAAACLAYLHGRAPPVVHRDIKPGNVLLRPDGSYCLVDFGSVRDRLKPEGGSTVVGTFGFMAPEQFQGRAGAGSDVYAVAATALALLTGVEPEDLPHKGLAIDVETALRGHADRRLIAALRSMLEPDPERRASSVASALERAGLSDAAPSSAETPARAAKRARKARLEAESLIGDWLDDTERKYRRQAERVGERVERRARKAARRAERHARRMAGWHGHRPGRPVPPGIVLGLLVLLAFRVASIATFALFQVLLPILFALLSVVGGPAMRRRAQRMVEIGQQGQDGLRRAGEHIRHQFLGGPEPAALKARPAPPRARVAAEAPEPELDEELAAAEAEIEAERRAR
jgi:hypothetical protein